MTPQPEQILKLGAADVKDLILDLRNALKRSQRTGGTYCVYRKNMTGDYILAIEIEAGAGEVV